MKAIKLVAKELLKEEQRAKLWSWRQQYQRFSKQMRRVWQSYWQSWKYAGNNYKCPCCEGSFSQFLPYGAIKIRENAKCPKCESLERHRLLWLYLQRQTNLFTDSLSLLHIAPEDWFQKKFLSLPNIDYLSADLESDSAMVKMDITNINYPDNHFDVIICNHVLEHIPDDHQAMLELFRVLKPQGWAILQVPIDLNREVTFEDLSVTSPEEREKLFGQKDHLRIYGRDYLEKLTRAGFQVKIDSFLEKLSPEETKEYGLLQGQQIYIGSKI